MTVPSLKIMAVGLRGIPHIQGGIETHAAELYPRLAKMGAEITVLGRRAFRPANIGESWRGIHLHWIWSPRRRGFEAAVHTVLGVLYAGIHRPDVLHIHAVGPSITVPLAKMLGLKVVVTHHGQDYEREKWNHAEKVLIRLGEAFAARFSDGLITISSPLQSLLRAQYGRDSALIPNGVGDLHLSSTDAHLKKYELTRGRYVIQVSRLVPEKRQLDLITAFQSARLLDWKLVLVGGSQGAEDYGAAVQQAAAGDNSIVCTGALPAPAAHELLSDAGLFVLPSSHEGLPIALLEAIAHGVPSLASDIPGNREIGLDADSYFMLGDTADLCTRLKLLADSPEARSISVRNYPRICSRFDWNQIAQATIAVMEGVSRRQRNAQAAKPAVSPESDAAPSAPIAP